MRTRARISINVHFLVRDVSSEFIILDNGVAGSGSVVGRLSRLWQCQMQGAISRRSRRKRSSYVV